ncbi:MAG: hypothetical protein LUE98_07745 [Tannerellaceae bacterium]|nr:hypothetical protein [Tannerellaceae bacterium]
MKRSIILLLSFLLVSCGSTKKTTRDSLESTSGILEDVQIKQESVKEDHSYLKIKEEETFETETIFYDTTLPADSLTGNPPVLEKKTTVRKMAVTYEKEREEKEEYKSDLTGRIKEDHVVSAYWEKEKEHSGRPPAIWIVILLTILIIILKNVKDSSK